MTATLLLDTGPLVALLNPKDRHHTWAREVLRVRGQVLSCEAVISEAFFLLQRSSRACGALRAMLAQRDPALLPLAAETGSIMKLLARYASVPMSFADGCLVRASELVPNAVVATTDTEFLIYRRFGRQVIPVLMP